MLFETIAITTLAGYTTASKVRDQGDDMQARLPPNQPWWSPDNLGDHKLFPKKHQSDKGMFLSYGSDVFQGKNTPLANTIDHGADTTNENDTIDAPDLGILEMELVEDKEEVAGSSGTTDWDALLGRNLDGTSPGTMDCEVYCGMFSAERPVIEDDELRSMIDNCATEYNYAGDRLDCPHAGVPLNCWNVTKVKNMAFAFFSTKEFNEPLNCWDVSQVVDMHFMFYGIHNFNQPLNEWDVSKVSDMNRMFTETYSFNQPLNEWDVSQVTNTYLMFWRATHFNQPLNEWDVSQVAGMSSMFRNASHFNQPLNEWDVSQVTDMRYMFENATAFNQRHKFKISKGTDTYNMHGSSSPFNKVSHLYHNLLLLAFVTGQMMW